MTDDGTLDWAELANLARARAAFYAFLNVHFQVLPDVPFVERLRNGELASVLEALVKETDGDADLATGASLMRDYIDKTRDVDAAKTSEELGVDRTRLYRGVAPGYGPPPPYEVVWSKNGQDWGLLTVIAGIYAKAGLQTSPEAHERPDYIGIELDFVRELALREADAWEAGDQATAKKLLQTQGGFLSEHVGQWVPAFVDRAMQQAETDLYRGHMLMLKGFLAEQQEELAATLQDVQEFVP